ncbi:hypothetical protein FACS1894206_06600 [Deltaproteobacteria bacterium]|nr:hypothetical protein FACS1894206_06600 [Deltaproteobacteria bacterium]
MVGKRHLLFYLALGSLLASCGGPPREGSPLLALDGPPLSVEGKGEGISLSGTMDRGIMAGFGAMNLYDSKANVLCAGTMDRPGTEKGRLYMALSCANGENISLVMRNLGPDQGMGLGRIEERELRFILFYHPSREEAGRRLTQVQRDIAGVREVKEKRQADQEN